VIVVAGRDEGPGRPLLYGTTPRFLERLGLSSLAALPSLAPLLGDPDDEDASRSAVDGALEPGQDTDAEPQPEHGEA
jgi:segregation and condensation protein B